MEILIGRQGEQEYDLSSCGSVSRKHCILKDLPNGKVRVTDKMSTNGTFIYDSNGVRKKLVMGGSADVDKSSMIGLGPNVEVKIVDLMKTKNQKVFKASDLTKYSDVYSYIDFISMFSSSEVIDQFLKELKEAVKNGLDLPDKHIEIVATIALAFLLIAEKKDLGRAQSLLYKLGDNLYDIASDDSKGVYKNNIYKALYASVMSLVSYLYTVTRNYDVADEAGRWAVQIYEDIKLTVPGTEPKNVAPAYRYCADAVKNFTSAKESLKFYKRALKLYYSVPEKSAQITYEVKKISEIIVEIELS